MRQSDIGSPSPVDFLRSAVSALLPLCPMQLSFTTTSACSKITTRQFLSERSLAFSAFEFVARLIVRSAADPRCFSTAHCPLLCCSSLLQLHHLPHIASEEQQHLVQPSQGHLPVAEEDHRRGHHGHGHDLALRRGQDSSAARPRMRKSRTDRLDVKGRGCALLMTRCLSL